MPSLPYSLEALLLGRKREFAGIIPDVIISEEHENEVIVTRHPVDTGANVADHAYCLPAVINCQFGWSDSSRLLNSILDFSIFKGLTKNFLNCRPNENLLRYLQEKNNTRQ